MNLRNVGDLEAVLAAIALKAADLQAAGVTHLRVGGIEVRFAPRPPGQDLVDALNRAAPLPDDGARVPPGVDPMAAIKAELKQVNAGVDILEALASGRRLVSGEDPLAGVPGAGA